MSQDWERRTADALTAILGSASGLSGVAVRAWRNAAESEAYPAVLVNVETAGQEPEDTGYGHLMAVDADIAVQTDLADDLSASACHEYLGAVRSRLKSATLATALSREMSATVFDWELFAGSNDIGSDETNMRSVRMRAFFIAR